MGFIPPPTPLPEEVVKRIANGARTLEEIDPALAKWAHGGIFGLFKRKTVNSILKKNIIG